jgi:type II secretory pathway pseudopilin PulG
MKSFNHRDNEEGFSLVDVLVTASVMGLLLIGAFVAGPALINNAKEVEARQEQSRKDFEKVVRDAESGSPEPTTEVEEESAVDGDFRE